MKFLSFYTSCKSIILNDPDVQNKILVLEKITNVYDTKRKFEKEKEEKKKQCFYKRDQLLL